MRQRTTNNQYFFINVRIKYACDLLIEKAEKMKETYPELIENVITDYKIALADPEVERSGSIIATFVRPRKTH